jgi:hypothetical protein
MRRHRVRPEVSTVDQAVCSDGATLDRRATRRAAGVGGARVDYAVAYSRGATLHTNSGAVS